VKAYDIMAPAMNLFRHFHPNTKPILWRILLSQVCLYRVLKKISNDSTLKIGNYRSFQEMYEAFKDMYSIDAEEIKSTARSP
jgi:hypothetical protein